MTRPKIVAISSSLSETSKTALLLKNVVGRFPDEAFDVTVLDLRGFAPAAFFGYPVTDAGMLAAIAAVEAADAVIIATPIYKASFSGLLKCFLDLLPQFALAGKVVLPLATGGSLAHVLALDYSLRPVIQSMGVRQTVQSNFLPEHDLMLDGSGMTLGATAERAVGEAVHHFKTSIAAATDDRLLGHPRPERALAS